MHLQGDVEESEQRGIGLPEVCVSMTKTERNDKLMTYDGAKVHKQAGE